MAFSRLGSLNALEQTCGSRFWRRWIFGQTLPSADTVGLVSTKIDAAQLRSVQKQIYAKLKRNKVFKSTSPYSFALILDGHESSSSHLCKCKGCLTRTMHTKNGDRVQYYHRFVSAMLYSEAFNLHLDIELQKPGEDEVAPAMRLLTRIMEHYSRAFNLILVDGLYVRAPFFKMALGFGKDVIAVLKDERRELFQDAKGLFNIEPAISYQEGKTTYTCWDVEGFDSWDAMDRPVRVVRSLEETPILRQLTKKVEIRKTQWYWVTTISKAKLSTRPLVRIAHKRWTIENNEFNELVTFWKADHVYRHHPAAIETFWLLTYLANNLFHAFIKLNLKPEKWAGFTKLYLANLIQADLYSGHPLCGIVLEPP